MVDTTACRFQFKPWPAAMTWLRHSCDRNGPQTAPDCLHTGLARRRETQSIPRASRPASSAVEGKPASMRTSATSQKVRHRPVHDVEDHIACAICGANIAGAQPGVEPVSAIKG